MGKYLVDVFGNSLASEAVKSDPIEDNCPLVSRNDLRYRILIKNEKVHQNINWKLLNRSGESLIDKSDWTVRSSSDEICCMETIWMLRR